MASRGRQSSAVWTLLSDSGIEYQPILAGVNRDLPFQMPAVVPRLRWRIRWLQLVDAVDFPNANRPQRPGSAQAPESGSLHCGTVTLATSPSRMCAVRVRFLISRS